MKFLLNKITSFKNLCSKFFLQSIKALKLQQDFLKNPVRLKALKITFCSGLALITALLLFYFMSALISQKDLNKKAQITDGLIEFTRVKPKSFLDEKKRKLPPKKPKQKAPPKMKHLTASLPKAQTPNPNTNMPNIKALLGASGPAVGGLGLAGDDASAQPLVRIEAQYPRRASMQGIEGWVFLQFDITASGSVSNVKVLDAKPPQIFNRAAIKALRKWKYRPQMEDGKPVERKNNQVQLDFKLGD